MILYLSRNETINLIDPVAGERSLQVRKMAGTYCLKEFVVRDMRRYVSCQYFCIDRLAASDDDNDFIEALKSFQTMYSAKIIVMFEKNEKNDTFMQSLTDNGITNLVTANSIPEKLKQLNDCLFRTRVLLILMTNHPAITLKKKKP